MLMETPLPMDNQRDTTSTLQEIKDAMKRFTDERDWNQFHDLKNLSMAVATEAAELMDHFRWVDNRNANHLMDDKESAKAIEMEVADVFLLLAEFCTVAEIDMTNAAFKKLAANQERYPIAKSRGTAVKYDRL